MRRNFDTIDDSVNHGKLLTCGVTALCNFCFQGRIVLPSIEAFEMGIEVVPVYFAFYEYFFKASVGESRWKRACLQATDLKERIGSVQDEAFALIQLKNNYFAWLVEAKTNIEGLVTDYDPDAKKRGMKNIREALLGKVMINLDYDEQDNGQCSNIVVHQNDEDNGDEEDNEDARGDDLYDSLREQADVQIKDAAKKARMASTEKYREVKKQVEEEHRLQQASNENNANVGQGRRKRMKVFRTYTNTIGEEGRFKGWSKRAAQDMATISKGIRQQDGKGKLFQEAYRQIYASRKNTGKHRKKTTDEVMNVDYEDEIWDIGAVSPVAI